MGKKKLVYSGLCDLYRGTVRAENKADNAFTSLLGSGQPGAS